MKSKKSELTIDFFLLFQLFKVENLSILKKAYSLTVIDFPNIIQTFSCVHEDLIDPFYGIRNCEHNFEHKNHNMDVLF